MNKKFIILLILITGFAKSNYACICSSLTSVATEYQRSSFVATIRIIKNYKNSPDTNQYYKADIEILSLYKGKEIKSIYVLGSNGNKTYNSCGTFIKEGEIRLIFGSLTKENQISIFLCTSYHQPLNAYYKRDSIAEKLDLLKKHASNYILNVKNDIAFYPYDFQPIRNPQLVNHYSLISILIDKNRKTKEITFLSPESEELKTIYKDYFIKTVDWENRLKNRVQLDKEEEVMLIIEIKPYKN